MTAFDEISIATLLRLLAALAAGMAVGLNRDLSGKSVGMRTLGLVALGAALVILAGTGPDGLHFAPDAVSRVIQGVLTGIGFIGAGVILHDRGGRTVHGLTTAASVWISAALGIAAGLGAWIVLIAGAALALLTLVFGRGLEHTCERLLGRHPADRDTS
jgi:putative Mg2+ transporter-C (MgtC) family protein